MTKTTQRPKDDEVSYRDMQQVESLLAGKIDSARDSILARIESKFSRMTPRDRRHALIWAFWVVTGVCGVTANFLMCGTVAFVAATVWGGITSLALLGWD